MVKKCKICGKIIPKENEFFCSKECQIINNKPTLVIDYCKYCKKKYTKNVLNKSQKFCSNACKFKMRSKHTEATKLKMKKSSPHYWKGQKFTAIHRKRIADSHRKSSIKEVKNGN